MSSLKDLEMIYEDNPNSILLRTFFVAKSDEILNILSEAVPNEKGVAVNILAKMDPVNSEKYRNLLKR